MKTKKTDGSQQMEKLQQRAQRLYDGADGPLFGWLLEEAHQRGISYPEMAKMLGVTCGELNRLHGDSQALSCIGQEFAQACARFLGVPAAAVKILAGQIRITDFAWPGESEEDMIERSYRRMRADSAVRHFLPEEDAVLDFEVKRSLVLLHGQKGMQDALSLVNLNGVMQYLSRLAMTHNDHEVESAIRKGELQPGGWDREECL